MIESDIKDIIEVIEKQAMIEDGTELDDEDKEIIADLFRTNPWIEFIYNMAYSAGYDSF